MEFWAVSDISNILGLLWILSHWSGSGCRSAVGWLRELASIIAVVVPSFRHLGRKSQQAAVDLQQLGRDVEGIVRSEKCNGLRDVLRHAEPGQIGRAHV